MLRKLAACAAILLCLALAAAPGVRAGSPIPQDLPVEEGYEPGTGESVGTVLQAAGRAVIVHSGERTGYSARSGLALYRGDALMTGEVGKLRLRLTDGSIITLSGGSRLELSRHVFEAGAKTRSSFLDMIVGKIRYLIRELSGFKRSEFRIRTPTAIAGIRGSDFIIEADRERTRITALKDTELEVFGLSHPERMRTITDYTRVRVERGKTPGKPEAVSAEEVRRLKPQFRFEGAERKDAVPAGEADGGSEGSASGRLDGGSAFPPGPKGTRSAGKAGMVVPEKELVLPEEAAIAVPPGHGGVVPGHIRKLERSKRRKEIRRGHERSKEAKKDKKAKKDKDIKPELPDTAVGP